MCFLHRTNPLIKRELCEGIFRMETYFVQNRQQAIEVRQKDDEWLLVNVKNFTMTKLDQMGGFCWSRLIEAHSLSMLMESARHYFSWDEDPKLMEETIQHRLNDLVSKGLIKPTD